MILRSDIKSNIRFSVILRNIFISCCFCIFFTLTSFATVTIDFAHPILPSVSYFASVNYPILNLRENTENSLVYNYVFFPITYDPGDTLDVDYILPHTSDLYLRVGVRNGISTSGLPYIIGTNEQHTGHFTYQFKSGDQYLFIGSAVPRGKVTEYQFIDASQYLTFSGNHITIDPSVSANFKTVNLPVGCGLEFDLSDLSGTFRFLGSGNGSDFGKTRNVISELWSSSLFTSGLGYFQTESLLNSYQNVSVWFGSNGYSLIDLIPENFNVVGSVKTATFDVSLSNFDNFVYLCYPYDSFDLQVDSRRFNQGSVTVQIPDNVPTKLIYFSKGISETIIEHPDIYVGDDGHYVDGDGNIIPDPTQRPEYQSPGEIIINDEGTGWLQTLINSITSIFAKPIQALQNLYNSGSSYISYLQCIWSWIPAEVTSFLVSAFIVVFSIGIIKSLL